MPQSSLEQIQAEIAAIEERIDNLRLVEEILAELEGKASRKPVHRESRKIAVKSQKPRKTKASLLSARPSEPQGREGSTPNAVLALLEAEGPLARAEIEQAIRADRDLSKQTISVALQRLKGAGKVHLDGGKWSLRA
ncbi:hypothetical protein [Beijerinckia indica]|uniref:Uncharacterized protein n=1 Tax=Beijerinckia indica subsp. indica (strain ATCC 9039 / DSM 1715 / NCIMB 8712) TaxID=395963 RepID=B2ILH5_BEII9|nr:hypothetical protein [Beijerinckia indica]ACB97375.1 hypothetical protein Bind_3846 [Beijerinckia indica subsp. indica ATCC 9039]